MGIDAGVELSAAAFCVASRHYMATYCAALRFSPQIVMRGDRDSFVMLAGTWGGKGNARCGQERGTCLSDVLEALSLEGTDHLRSFDEVIS